MPKREAGRGAVVLGVPDIRRMMLSLSQRDGLNVVRKGLLAGAGVIREEARRLAPVQKGNRGKAAANLKKSIKAETRRVFKDASGVPVDARAVVFVENRAGKSGRDARKYAHLVELGTSPHAVGKGSKLKTRSKSDKAELKQVGLRHPGAKAQPFMRPAFDTQKFAAIEEVVKVTRRELANKIAGIGKTRKRAS